MLAGSKGSTLTSWGLLKFRQTIQKTLDIKKHQKGVTRRMWGWCWSNSKHPTRAGCYFTWTSRAHRTKRTASSPGARCHEGGSLGCSRPYGQGQHISHNLSNIFLGIHQAKKNQPGVSPAQTISGNPRKKHYELIFTVCCIGLELKELSVDPIPELKSSQHVLKPITVEDARMKHIGRRRAHWGVA